MPASLGSSAPSVEAFLLGRIDLEDCLRLQRTIADDIAARDDGRIALLLAEHPPVISVGRSGSPAHIESEFGLLRQRRIGLKWVKRGGGCLVHCPGQLAMYPIAPIRWHGWSVGQYLDRLQRGLHAAMEQLGIALCVRPGQYGLWGRTGRIAALGVAVRDHVTCHGAFLNVDPPMGLFRLVGSDATPESRVGSLVAERRRPVKMTKVRAEVIRQLSFAFDCDRYHLFTGHPRLPRNAGAS